MPAYRAQYSIPPAPPAVPIGMVCGECGGLVPDTERQTHDNWHEWLHKAVTGPKAWAEVEITEELARQLLRRMLELQQEGEG